MKTFTKEKLVDLLKHIRERGWIENTRGKNHGAPGNILEDLLGIEENNLPIPNAAEWELKTQRASSSSLVTLFHCEPSPTACRFVPSILLPKFGWRHREAGRRYHRNELSFRQTINCLQYSDRGFKVRLNIQDRKVEVEFDYKQVTDRHKQWLNDVEKRIGLNPLDPMPYWGFDDLFHKVGAKLTNCFFVKVKSKKEGKREYFLYDEFYKLSGLSLDCILGALEKGDLLVDFDARTGHNHGTKFRFRSNKLAELYTNQEKF